MPNTRITTNFELEKEQAFVDEFQRIMVGALKIPEYDRLVLLETNIEGFFQPTNTSGRFMLFEIDLFPGRTGETKRKLYGELVALAGSQEVESANVRIVLKEVAKENWGIRGGQPASDIDLGFKTDV